MLSQLLRASLKEKQMQAGQLEEFLYSLPDTNKDGLISRYEVSWRALEYAHQRFNCFLRILRGNPELAELTTVLDGNIHA